MPPAMASAIETWDVDSVAEWISALDSGSFAELAPVFRAHQVSGDVLVVLTKEELKYDLGVDTLGRRKRLLAAIAKMHAGL